MSVCVYVYVQEIICVCCISNIPSMTEKLTLFILKVHDTDLPSCLPSFTLILTHSWNLLPNIGMYLTDILIKSLILLPLHAHMLENTHSTRMWIGCHELHIIDFDIRTLIPLSNQEWARKRDEGGDVKRETVSIYIWLNIRLDNLY